MENLNEENTTTANTFDFDETFSPDLLEKIHNLPTKPGVYQYKNQAGTIIYVGKAKNIRNRVRSYFQHGRPVDAKTKALVKKIADVEIIVVDSEAEALILENILIKEHKPKYNILLRDDKSYPYVRVTNEAFPRVFITRKIIRDGSKYFGPFTEVRVLKRTMQTLRTVLLLRSCKLNLTKASIEKKKFRICLDYHIKKCEGPCEGLISQEDYNRNVQEAIQFLNGKTKQLENLLLERMEKLSEDMKFEEAAILRNRLIILRDYLSNQKIVTTEQIDRDIIGLSRIEESACTIIFKVRDGKLIGRRHYIIPNAVDISDSQLIQSTIEKWFLETEFFPKELYLPIMPDQIEFIESWLKEKHGKKVEVIIPKVGEKKKLVTMAQSNAEFLLRDYLIALMKRDQTVPKILQSLERDLRLPHPPRRIECFDNSHIQGSELVSSMVIFVDAKPKKSEYRKFKLRNVTQNDDFAAMRETVERRYKRLIDEKLPLPDLIIIDGGKGQLSSAVEILKKLEIYNKVKIIGIAKRLEEIFSPDSSEPLMLPKSSSSLRLIQQLRDEAHRFAITFHRQLRDKRTIKTELTEIKGIGEKTAQKLLTEFGSVEGIKNTPYENIKEKFSEKIANAIKSHFEK